MNKTNTDQISIIGKSKVMSMTNKKYPLEEKIPNNIMVELTNVCNLKCKMCYNKQMKRKKGFMSFDLYKRIVDQAHELKIENMGLYTVGESFLHRQIFDCIKYAKQKGIKYVYITTNGQALNEEKIEAVFESGLDSIKFSIDAGNKGQYESLKIGASWSKLVETIKKMRIIRDETKSNLRIFASYIVMADNFDDLMDYQSAFGDLIDETMFSLISNQGSQVNVSDLYPDSVKSIIHNLILPKNEWNPCSLLWNRFIITYEGYLTICCVDFDNQLIYGDLNKEPLKDCWNNDNMKQLRKIHKSKDFEKLPMCHNCDGIKRNIEVFYIMNREINEILKHCK